LAELHTNPIHLIRNFAIAFLELIFGVTLVIVVLFDVFETIVVPRRTDHPLRLAPYILIFLWPVWRRIGLRIQPAWRRENFLATFAPFILVTLLVAWVLALVLGYGLILHTMADQLRPPINGLFTALYSAGTSFFTIGFGDYVPLSAPARMVMLLAGASGMALMALVISLVFNLYSSFARREVLVLMLNSRAGAPPSGVMLLETFGRNRCIDELAITFAQFEKWTAEVLDSHLAYPILPFFRSSHDSQSWVSALGAVIDAATLLMTVVDEDFVDAPKGLRKCRSAAEFMHSLGCHALEDLTQNRLMRRHIKRFGQHPGIERAEFETACQRLREVGYRAVATDESWAEFSQLRSVYAERLNLLAGYFSSPPTQWIGDRTFISHHYESQHRV
jgi:hypothetical protein